MMPRQVIPRLRTRLGLRGWLIVTLAPWWLFLGFHAATAGPLVAEETPIELLPGWTRGIMWVATCPAACWLARDPDRQPWAVRLLMVMPSAQLTSYAAQAVTVLVERATLHEVEGIGLPFGWLGWAYSVAVYSLLVRAVWMASQIPGARQ